MARFFSNHEMKKFDKKFTEENLLNTDRYKEQLKVEISKDNHRVNIDSAKKKAVLQGMNYDGFHQMVLGADLKGIKQGEIININIKNSIMNNTNVQKKLNDPHEILKNSLVPFDKNESGKVIKSLEELKIEEDFLEKEKQEKFDFKNFIKEWKLININYTEKALNNQQTYNYSENLDKKLSLIKKFSYEDFKFMLDQEKLSSDVFLDLINFYGELTNYFIVNAELYKLKEIIIYFKNLLESKFYSSLKIFIGKKQKTFFNDFKNELEKEEQKEKIDLCVTDPQMNLEDIRNVLNSF